MPPETPPDHAPAELIRHKRDGGVLSAGEIDALVAGIVDGSMSDAQVAAFAMAVYFRGMTREECAALTRAMTRSGTVLDWSEAGLERPGPRQALDRRRRRQGQPDPRAGGRGLRRLRADDLGPRARAHGRHARQAREHSRATTSRRTSPASAPPCAHAGCAIVGQTAELAPADRRLYAIRDVTATVDSLPLITASILSKKLAAGLDALVMDVKVGSGALLPSLDERDRRSPRACSTVAGDAGLRAVALLTDMNQALGHHVGNALEVREASTS